MDASLVLSQMNTMKVGVVRRKNGIFDWLSLCQKKAQSAKKVVILGLDDCGKTTILRRLDEDGITQLLPTAGYQIKTLRCPGGIYLRLWDIGGRDENRSLWSHYLKNVDALIYVVDAHDRDRLQEAFVAMHTLLLDPQLEGVPILIFANKMDLYGALRVDSIKKVFAGILRPFKSKVFECSARTGVGIQLGLEWLLSELIYRDHCGRSNFFW